MMLSPQKTELLKAFLAGLPENIGLRLAKAERFIYRHRDLEHLETGLRDAAALGARRRVLFRLRGNPPAGSL